MTQPPAFTPPPPHPQQLKAKTSPAQAWAMGGLPAQASEKKTTETHTTTGFDLVFIPDFAAQLRAEGTRFGRVFTDREWRHLRACANPDASAAGLWAAKEALVKAWSARLFGQAPPIREEEFDWREVQVVHDAWGRPALVLSGRVSEATSRLGLVGSSLSISHDGDYAAAWVQITWGSRPAGA